MPGLSLLLLGIAAAWQPVAVDSVAEAYRVFGEGRAAEESGELAAAADAYERAAALDPEGSGPLVALAAVRAREEDLDGAREAAVEAVRRDPDAAAAHRLLGELHLLAFRADQDPATADRAIAAFEAVLRVEPDDLRSRSRLARALGMMQRPDDAEFHLRELVRRAPEAYGEYVLLAELRLRDGDPTQAFADVLQALRIEPRQPAALELVDEILATEDPDFDRAGALEALADLHGKAVEDHPEDPELGIAHADALARQGRGDEARAAFERVLAGDPDNAAALWGVSVVLRTQHRLDDAEAALNRMVELDDASVPARFALSGIHFERCDYARAGEEIDALLGLPDNAFGPHSRPDFLVRRAHVEQALGRYPDAVETLLRAVEFARDRRDLLRFRVLAVEGRLLAGEVEEAAREVSLLVARHPDELAVAALEARVKAALGEAKAARQVFEKLLEENPDDPALVHAFARHLAGEQDFAGAETVVRSWLEGDPDNVAFRFQLGAVLERQGRAADAEAAFRAVLAASPDHALALNYLGYMLSAFPDRLEESERLIRGALAADPYNGSYLDSLGWVQYQRGAIDEAEPNLLQAARCMPRNAVVLDHLGDLYRDRGDSESAVRYWRRALQHDDEDELDDEAVAGKIREAEPDSE